MFVERSWVAVARARAHGRFGRRIRIARGGSDPKVAIDERGTALISFAYFDKSAGEFPEDRGDTCCMGAKVAVWRRERSRPTAPRAVTRRGVTAEVNAVAARQGRRGVLYTEFAGYRLPSNPVRFAPVRVDGRLGQARVIAGNGLTGATLQFSGGRANRGADVSRRHPRDCAAHGAAAQLRCV